MAGSTGKATYQSIKDALHGRAVDVLTYCGHDASYADGRHHLCPCGSIKLRISNRDTGAGGCDACGVRWTNLADMAGHLLGIDGDVAKDRLADRFGIVSNGSVQKVSPPVATQLAPDGYIRHPEILTSHGWHAECARRFIAYYSDGFSASALEDAGMEMLDWQATSTAKICKVPAIPILRGPNLDLVNYTIYGLDTGKRLAYGRYPKDRDADIPFDRNGVSMSLAAREMMLRGEPVKGLRIVKTEGISDYLALLSIIPPDEPYLVWSNNDGASSTNCAEWLLPLFDRLRPSEYIIIHDRDLAGVNGADKWARIFDGHRLSEADETLGHSVKVVELPMEYTEKKGADLMDWLRQGNRVLDIETLIDGTGEYVRPPGESLVTVDPSDAPETTSPKTKQSSAPEISIRSFGTMVEQYTHLRPERIEGLLRDTELLNIIAAPKIGKSYLVGGMAICIATGRPWMGRETRQGRVLMVDNELHPELTTDRLRRICRAMEMDDHEVDESIDVLSLRGACCDIHEMERYFATIEKGHYGLIVLDALYRTLPPGASENDNAAMTAIFNKIDHYAEMTGSAFAIVHHSSKGDQSDKSVTDMGSGAGSISRATDTHLVIRPHETEGMAVLEAVTRSFIQVDPISIKWEYPQWVAVAVAPVVRKRKATKEVQQESSDTEADTETLAVMRADATRTWTTSQIRRKLGYGETRAGRAIQRLLAGGEIGSRSEVRRGETTDVYFSIDKEIKDGTPDGTA